MTIQELSEIMKNAGVVGAGGAGFPAYGKLSDKADTIIMNCAECEPLLRLHRQLLQQKTREIFQMLVQIGETLGAKNLIVATKRAYRNTTRAIEETLPEFPQIQVCLLEEVYPAGDEVVLVYEATKRVVPPGAIPIQVGVIVYNVETIYNTYRAWKEKQPVTDKLVTVMGEVNHDCTIRVPLGCTVEEVVELAGGKTIADPVYLLGGPMMGSIGTGSTLVTKTTNAILVLPPEHPLIQKKTINPQIGLKRAAASCCQCETCTEMCPRFALGHPVEPHKFMRAAAFKETQNTEIFINTMFCSSCGICELYACPQGLSPRSLMAEYKAGLRKAGVKPPKGVEAGPVIPQRELRKVPRERLLERLGLSKYFGMAPLDNEVKPVTHVRELLSQHIGAPAVPVVKAGDQVEKGQLIAKPAEGLSTSIHASISGVVCEVADRYIEIKAVRG